MNLIKLADSLPIATLLDSLRANEYLWREYTFRQDHPASPHHDTEAIYLRYCEEISVHSVFNELIAVPYPAADVLDGWRELVLEVMRRAGASELGRVMIARLKPVGVIDAHVDEGAYADHYERFHVPLESEPGNLFQCGDDSVHMRPGEAWWFNHKALHHVSNYSTQPRTHLIIDAVAPMYRVERRELSQTSAPGMT